jgi:predicted N-acetyltransferase YhbS
MYPKTVNRPVTPEDLPAISALHAEVFGPGRFTRTAYRVREAGGSGTPPFSRFCRVAVSCGRLLAAVRLTEITIGATGGALLLGPLAVRPDVAGQGFGRALVADALDEARRAGIGLVVLVGDEPYYARFGFKRVPAGHILFPGPVNPARILAVELAPDALASFRGMVAAADHDAPTRS